MIVMKFGGTSVKNASAMGKVIEIVRGAIHQKPVIVLSACGGITDKLLQAVRLSGQNARSEAMEFLDDIEQHHLTLCRELISEEEYYAAACTAVQTLLHELRTFCEGVALLGECTLRSLDAVASVGERLSTTIFSIAAQAVGINTLFFDARTVMRTNDAYTKALVHTSTLRIKAHEAILPHIEQGKVVVTQGFIGSTEEGITTTIGRGGGDLSAALFGAALDAEEIQIWTDVSGILSADPRSIPQALSLPEMTFAEVRQLAYYGAKVLHPDTIKPAVEKDIPVKVLNTFNPSHPGTMILHHSSHPTQGLRAVTVKNGCQLLSIETATHGDAPVAEVLAVVLAEAASKGIEVFAAYAGESSCSIVVHESNTALIERADAHIPVSLLCACGPNLRSGAGGVLGDVAAVLEQHQPLALLWGVSEVSFLALFTPDHIRGALASVHGVIEKQLG